jgi:glycosyltransferase involved in cell wall biosynthesis
VKVVLVSKTHVRGASQRTLEELVNLGDVDLTVISPPSWREGTTTLPLERRYTRGYELLVTPIVLNGHYHVYYYPKLAAHLRRLRPDLVHVDEEPYNLATWLAFRAAHAAGAPGLFYTWQNLHRVVPFPFSRIEQLNYRHARAAIAANTDAADVLRRKHFARPIWIIPPGLDPELYVPTTALPSNVFQVGYVGRLVKEKGVDLLIRGCASLADPWQLTLVGDGEERSALEKLAEVVGVRDRVNFVGRVASTDVPLVLQRLSVLVLPSRSLPNWREQFGRVLLEAMACAVPVVGSSSGEIPRVIGDAGLVFPENDASALAVQLKALQGDRDRCQRLGWRGRERVLSQFTLRSVAAQTLAVYRTLLTTPA